MRYGLNTGAGNFGPISVCVIPVIHLYQKIIQHCFHIAFICSYMQAMHLMPILNTVAAAQAWFGSTLTDTDVLSAIQGVRYASDFVPFHNNAQRHSMPYAHNSSELQSDNLEMWLLHECDTCLSV